MTNHQLKANSSLLFLVDIQERLLPAIPTELTYRLMKATQLLVQAANLYDVPVLVSEQYPRGLGPTVEPLATLLAPMNSSHFEKSEFSGWKNTKIATELESLKPSSVVICGIEAHICVLQTTLDLLAEGYNVHIVTDGIASRSISNLDVGINQMRDAGAIISSAETVAFQWAEKAGTAQFKALSKLVR